MGTYGPGHTKYTTAEAIAAVEAEATLVLAGDVTIDGAKTLGVDVINEKDSGAGVTIDGLLIKDSKIGNNLTVANANDLTDGGASTLHSHSGGGVAVDEQVFTGSGDWTKPSGGQLHVAAIAIGGGGGGGGGEGRAAGTMRNGGSGAGGAGYAYKFFDIAELGSSETITIGAGGAGGAGGSGADGANGVDGGTTTIGSLLSVTGGIKGLASTDDGSTKLGGAGGGIPGGNFAGVASAVYGEWSAGGAVGAGYGGVGTDGGKSWRGGGGGGSGGGCHSSNAATAGGAGGSFTAVGSGTGGGGALGAAGGSAGGAGTALSSAAGHGGGGGGANLSGTGGAGGAGGVNGGGGGGGGGGTTVGGAGGAGGAGYVRIVSW